MRYGEALLALDQGEKIARKGWNGKGMFVFMVGAGTITHPAVGSAPAAAYLALKGADGIVVPWVASQADTLADDFEIVS